MPQLSAHTRALRPSVIRMAQIAFAQRKDGVDAVNVAIGNVHLPMHPALQRRMATLAEPGSPFADGVVCYSATVGMQEACDAVLNVIASGGFDVTGLLPQITDGGSAAMELALLALCGPAGSDEAPLLLIDAAYTNYASLARRTGRRTVSVQRRLDDDGRFALPALDEVEAAIEQHRPAALLVIPYDNPTGQFYDQAALDDLGRLAVKHDLWLLSDEAYRELFYTSAVTSSVWGITEDRVPGITGRRLSIETASKVWNACGLRIGALVSDNEQLHRQSVAEYTANLCANVIGQHIFGALAHERHQDLQAWYAQQRAYYWGLLQRITGELRQVLPGLIVSRPDAALYSVVDVRDLVGPDFDALDFVMYCAREGVVEIDGARRTLLVAPMAGFYTPPAGAPNPGRTQMRIAYVETEERCGLVAPLFAQLLTAYLAR